MKCRASRLSMLVGLAALAVLLAGEASAYRDVQWIGQTLLPGESVGGVFDIQNPSAGGIDCAFLFVCDVGGFTPGEETIVDARASFVFADFGEVEASILLGPDGGPNQGADVDRFVFFIGFESLDLNAEMRGDLNADGQLEWQLTNTAPVVPSLATAMTGWGGGTNCGGNGDDGFYLKFAKLEAAVPEPSAALLFCLGFGVAGTATRRSRTP